ncbi:oxidoreductase [Nemania sp. FL0031]|nr:oxidoreductase [Nemania sp. FL0031]
MPIPIQMMEENYAAFLVRPRRKPFDVDEAEARFPDEDELVIKNAAVSINPIDIFMQDEQVQNLTTPAILGADVAGEVVEVGSQVNRFSAGDRVMGHALRLATEDDRHAAFQNFTVLLPNMACQIPPSLSYEDASTMPLGISTAAAALFQEKTLNLRPPVQYPPTQDEWVIIAGATGNVGSHGVRLAAAAGYKVLGTASTSSFDVAKKLGATELVDYKSKDLAGTLARKLDGQRVAGAFDASGTPSSNVELAKALADCEGNRVLTTVLDWWPGDDPVPQGVTFAPIQAIDIRNNAVGKMVWEDYLPDALATGKYFIPFPKAKVVGTSLKDIQGAMDNKVSGGKAVVTLK